MRRPMRLFAAALGGTMALVLALSTALPARAQQELIVSVEVEGNAYISRDAILDAVRDILRVGDPFTPAAADRARQAVAAMGYFVEQGVTVSHTLGEEGVQVVITVVERPRLEQIVFVGNTVASDAALQEIIHSQVGNIVDYAVIRRDVGRLEEHYSRQGYIARVAQARVDPFGVLTFVIDEARIEGFRIEGLEKTKEWVVRRMIHTQPGALFRQESIAKDLQRVFNLGIFQGVQSDLRPGEVDPTAVLVIIQVEEKRTGVASVAAAYSELDDFVFMVSVAETNFRGRAQRASLDVEAFGRTSYDLRFFEPFLDRHDTTADLSIFDTERRRRFLGGAGFSLPDQEFQERRSGSSLRFTRPMAANQRVSLGFRTEEVSSSFFQGTRTIGAPGTWGPMSAPQPAQFGWDNDGGYVPVDPNLPPGPGDLPTPIVVAAPLHPGGRVNSTTLGYVWDTRDLIADPRRGSFREVSWEWAGGLLGGENDFSLYSAQQRLYLPARGGQDVLALRLLAGTSSGNVPLFDSYSVGGSTSLRGYRQDRFRGTNMLMANVEYRYRLSEGLGLVAFVDAGDAYGGTFPTVVPGFSIPAEDQEFKLHVGMGLGLRAVTPLGPIRIDWGVGSEGSEIHFGFGQVF